MTPGLDHYNRIREIDRNGETFLRTKEEIPNHYGNPDNNPPIPKGAIIQAEFGHESGMYGRYSLPGSFETTKCQVNADHFHMLEFVADEK